MNNTLFAVLTTFMIAAGLLTLCGEVNAQNYVKCKDFYTGEIRFFENACPAGWTPIR